MRSPGKAEVGALPSGRKSDCHQRLGGGRTGKGRGQLRQGGQDQMPKAVGLPGRAVVPARSGRAGLWAGSLRTGNDRVRAVLAPACQGTLVLLRCPWHRHHGTQVQETLRTLDTWGTRGGLQEGPGYVAQSSTSQAGLSNPQEHLLTSGKMLVFGW